MFSQFVEERGPIPAAEVVASPEADGHVHIELIPARGVQELQSMIDGYVNRLEQHTKKIEVLSDALRQFPEQNPSPILRAGIDGSLQYANPAARSLKCVQENELAELSLHLDLKDKIVAAKEPVFFFEVDEFIFEVHSVWSKHLEAYTIYVTDVTAEKVLAKTQQEIKQFPESNPNPVLRFSAEGELLYCNPGGLDKIEWALKVGERLPAEVFEQFQGQDSSTFDVEIGSKWFSITTVWSDLVQSHLAYFTDITPVVQNKAILDNLARYFSPEVAQHIVSRDGAVSVETQRKKLTVFFSDIVGFSRMTVDLEAEVITEVLYEYLTEMTTIADRWGATVDKYIGDAMMVFFGDPDSEGEKEDAERCILMALEMQNAIGEVQSRWRSKGVAQPLQVRMGIHTGVCTVGNFGSRTRLDYTAVGNGVNVAARLEGIAEANSILCSEETALLVQNVCTLKRMGSKSLKNIASPYVVYQVSPKQGGARSFFVEEPGMSVRLDLSSVGQERAAELLEGILEDLKKP